jgi:hypothetical protein
LNLFRKFFLLSKEIGIKQLIHYANYRLKLKSGIVERQTTRPPKFPFPDSIDKVLDSIPAWFKLPQPGSDLFDTTTLLADEVVKGFYRPFRNGPEQLNFSGAESHLQHWSKYGDRLNSTDIKNIWEPARFSWAFDLAIAYQTTNNEVYPETFWRNFELFSNANPPYLGPNWSSSQEVALRGITWILVLPTFVNSKSSTPFRMKSLIRSLWEDGFRIPPTLAYAKSQNNNHLLSEALGLFMVGSLFSSQSQAARGWVKTGSRLFEKALLDQIDPDGTYSQHSANYHRLMLQLALIYYCQKSAMGSNISPKILQRLALATRWLVAQLDFSSGTIPNLGHNDGSLFLAFGADNSRDYRPTIQAASLAFLGEPSLPAGKWDELSFYLGLRSAISLPNYQSVNSPAVHRVGNLTQWATLRAVTFHGRPAHADQLHTEIWWDGINLAQDAGTFSYNALPPWENALAVTRVHNTVTIDRMDQMIRYSKFLWLDRAQGFWLPSIDSNSLSASHNGYKKQGVKHTRFVKWIPDQGFEVLDKIELTKLLGSKLVTLHWLLPDWKWRVSSNTLVIQDKDRTTELSIECRESVSKEGVFPLEIKLIRAGEALISDKSDPIMGWVSPTYGNKIPALSLSITWQVSNSIVIRSNWMLKKEKS